MNSSASLTSGPDGRKRRVSYIMEPHIGVDCLLEHLRICITNTLILSYEFPCYRDIDFSYAKMATPSDFLQFHTQEYVEFLASVTRKNRFDPSVSGNLRRFNLDTSCCCPVIDGLFDYCRTYAGGTINSAVKLNRQEADIAINWTGGMHRVNRDKASGFGYVNDIVLGILELLKVFKRVLYIDIGYRHGNAVEEAFYTTDRVMTVSFHKLDDSNTRTGYITDFGVGKGMYYSLNAPLEEGLCDASFHSLFMPVIQRVMEVYQPEAIVLQSGADTLTGDRVGRFNLSIKGHSDCLQFIRSFNIPLMVLGGGGYTVQNVARCWCHETAVALGVELDNNIPYNEYYHYFAPYYKLHIEPNHMRNYNTPRSIEIIRNRLLSQLSQLVHAPSVQFQHTPPISQVTETAEVDMERRQTRRQSKL